jgi:hypothetical protein
MCERPYGSAQEAVRAVGILQKVFGVSARISTAMLWKENAVCMVRPTGTGPPDVIGAEARGKVSTGDCTANVFDELAHDVKCRIHAPGPEPPASAIGRRQKRAPQAPDICA